MLDAVATACFGRNTGAAISLTWASDAVVAGPMRGFNFAGRADIEARPAPQIDLPHRCSGFSERATANRDIAAAQPCMGSAPVGMPDGILRLSPLREQRRFPQPDPAIQ